MNHSLHLMNLANSTHLTHHSPASSTSSTSPTFTHLTHRTLLTHSTYLTHPHVLFVATIFWIFDPTSSAASSFTRSFTQRQFLGAWPLQFVRGHGGEACKKERRRVCQGGAGQARGHGEGRKERNTKSKRTDTKSKRTNVAFGTDRRANATQSIQTNSKPHDN